MRKNTQLLISNKVPIKQNAIIKNSIFNINNINDGISSHLGLRYSPSMESVSFHILFSSDCIQNRRRTAPDTLCSKSNKKYKTKHNSPLRINGGKFALSVLKNQQTANPPKASFLENSVISLVYSL